MIDIEQNFSANCVQPGPKNSPWRPELEEFLHDSEDSFDDSSKVEEDPQFELSQNPGDGSASKADCRASEMEYSDNELFLFSASASMCGTAADAVSLVATDHGKSLERAIEDVQVALDRTAWKPPSTVFLVSDQEGLSRDPTKWTRLSRLQHDVGPDYTDRNRKSTLIQGDDKYRRCATVLQRIEIPYPEQEYAISKTMAGDMRRFNHYEGVEGAAIGFALYALYSEPEEAQDSVHADLAIDLIPGFSERVIRQLTDYVFSKEGAS